jgi:hypothetical protein
MLTISVIILSVLFLIFFFSFQNYRREMLWAGGLSAPLVLLWSVPGYGVNPELVSSLINISLRLAFGFCFAAVAAALYELIFYKHLKLTPHPHRAKLSQFLLGPVVFLLLAVTFHQFAIASLFVGFLAELSILTYHRKELLWEAVVAGLLMALIYVTVFLLISRVAPDNGLSLLAGGFSGVDVLGLPVEELLFVFGYGMLWGPLYEGVKKGQF